jgi:hypothetical protein
MSTHKHTSFQTIVSESFISHFFFHFLFCNKNPFLVQLFYKYNIKKRRGWCLFFIRPFFPSSPVRESFAWRPRPKAKANPAQHTSWAVAAREYECVVRLRTSASSRCEVPTPTPAVVWRGKEERGRGKGEEGKKDAESGEHKGICVNTN